MENQEQPVLVQVLKEEEFEVSIEGEAVPVDLDACLNTRTEVVENLDKSNPMLISEVVEIIFKFVDGKRLSTVCRLVNKKWNAEACRILKESMYLSLVVSTDPDEDLQEIHCGARFTRFWTSRPSPSLDHPFGQIKLNYYGEEREYFVPQVELPLELTELEVIQDFKPWIDMTRVLDHHMTTLVILKLEINELILTDDGEAYHFPALKKLTLLNEIDFSVSESTISNLIRIIGNAPKLEFLSLKNMPCPESIMVRILESLGSTSISNLEVAFSELTETLATVLRTLPNLQGLRRFKLNLNSYNEEKETEYIDIFVRTIIPGIAPNIRVLDFFGVPINPAQIDSLLKDEFFPNLVTLSLWEFYVASNFCSERFPALKNLSFGSISSEDAEPWTYSYYNPAGEPSPGIETLKIDMDKYRMKLAHNPLDYIMVSKKFTNVQHLQVHHSWLKYFLNNVNLQVCDWTSSLKALTIFSKVPVLGDLNALQLISGFGKPTVGNIWTWRLCKKRKIDVEGFRRHQCLLDFKGLKTLDWKSLTVRLDSQISQINRDLIYSLTSLMSLESVSINLDARCTEKNIEVVVESFKDLKEFSLSPWNKERYREWERALLTRMPNFKL